MEEVLHNLPGSSWKITMTDISDALPSGEDRIKKCIPIQQLMNTVNIALYAKRIRAWRHMTSDRPLLACFLSVGSIANAVYMFIIYLHKYYTQLRTGIHKLYFARLKWLCSQAWNVKPINGPAWVSIPLGYCSWELSTCPLLIAFVKITGIHVKQRKPFRIVLELCASIHILLCNRIQQPTTLLNNYWSQVQLHRHCTH